MEQSGALNIVDMLEARERRADRQKRLLMKFPRCLISFTMNIPGSTKVSPLILKSFEEGKRMIGRALSFRDIPVLASEETAEKTGFEHLWVVDGDPFAVKRQMVLLESGCSLGRLLDIDVIRPDGGAVSRTELGFPPRSCLLCSGEAHACARARRHGFKELAAAAESLMARYFREARADEVASAACRAMMYEVGVTPKPGLVDRRDSGAHGDMDYFTFADSAGALTPWFRKFFLLGAENAGLPPGELLPRLRWPGVLAEDAMYGVTRGVNTHKGLIFSLGILCAALGWIWENEPDGQTAGRLLDFCGEMATPALSQELMFLSAETASTAGEKLYLEGGGGARSEAAGGFPTVRLHGLPVLENYLAQGCSMNDAGAYTLLHLMAHASDSNLYARAGATAQREIAEKMKVLIRGGRAVSLTELEELNRTFTERKVSPGGCADLLAITYFLHFLYDKND